MTSQVLRKLQDKGLIERAVDPDDTRARRLQVTGRGAEPPSCGRSGRSPDADGGPP